MADDIRHFRRPEAFELVINLCSSIQYFDDEMDYEQVVGNVYASLKPGGRLVLEIAGREAIALGFGPAAVHRYPDGTVVVEERQILDNWERIGSTWTRISDGVVSSHDIRMRLYGAVDLTALLRDSGFGSVDVFGSLDGTPYDHTARRLVVVAHK